jgi:hypothetical protein
VTRYVSDVVLRIGAGVGVIASGVAAILQLRLERWLAPPFPEVSVACGAVVVGTLAMLLVFLGQETRSLFKSADPLVPLGWALLVEAAFALPGPSFIHAELAPGSVASVSIASVLRALAWIVAATWATILLVARARGTSLTLSAALGRAWRAWPHAFVVYAAVSVVGVSLLVILLNIRNSDTMPLRTALVGLLALALNLLSAHALVALFDGDLGPGLGGLRAGLGRVRTSLRASGARWAGIVVLQLLLFGAWTYVRATADAASQRDSVNTNLFWVGGFEAESNWPTDVADVNGLGRVPAFARWATALFGYVLSAAIKLRIARRMPSRARTEDQELAAGFR